MAYKHNNVGSSFIQMRQSFISNDYKRYCASLIQWSLTEEAISRFRSKGAGTGKPRNAG